MLLREKEEYLGQKHIFIDFIKYFLIYTFLQHQFFLHSNLFQFAATKVKYTGKLTLSKLNFQT